MSAWAGWQAFLRASRRFPWRETGRTLRDRFREDRLGVTASSLTFTTVISLVPLFTVLLAVFSAFPAFAKLQGVMQQWLADSLFPDAIARQVMGYLTQFAAKARRVGAVGFAFLLVTAISLILTIDRTLNGIWRVRRRRPLAQRVLMYWAVLTMGPLVMAASLAITSYAVSVSRGWVGGMPAALNLALDGVEFVLAIGAVAALYRFVPNTAVRWPHAIAGGLWVAAGLELAKGGLAMYLKQMPSFSVIYGAFATVPILLLWIYLAWVVVLLGAVIAAYLPSLLAGVERRGGTPGWRFQLAVETVRALERTRGETVKGLDAAHLAQVLRVDTLQLEPVLDALTRLDWVGQLEDGREMLLVDLDRTPAQPLVDALLLADEPAVAALRERVGVAALTGRDLVGALGAAPA